MFISGQLNCVVFVAEVILLSKYKDFIHTDVKINI